MSSVAESLTYDGEAMLAQLPFCDDPSKQLQALLYYNPVINGKRPLTPESVDGLVDFAADESLKTPLCVRVEALERALEQGFGSEVLNQESAQYLQDVESSVRYVETTQKAEKDSHKTGRDYRYLSFCLMDNAGLDYRNFYDATKIVENDYIGTPDANPYLAYVFLDKVLTASAGSESTPNTTEAIQKFIPLANGLYQELANIHGVPEAKKVRLQDWRSIAICRGLADSGDNYSHILAELLDAGNHQVLEYVRVLGRMEHSTHLVAKAFPEEFRESVVKGTRQLLADALYAVAYHLEHGDNTDIALPLSGGESKLKLHLSNNEPLDLLNYLDSSFVLLLHVGRMARDFIFDSPKKGGLSEVRASAVTKTKDAALYRLVDKENHSQVSVYIRPRGSHTFDPNLEYGRAGEGVEASISYVIDPTLQPGQLLEVGKHRRTGPDNRISIRLDREGVRPEDRANHAIKHDPTQSEGTLSLDVGSVLGNDEWTSTKLGRLLAWGNMLRTAAQGEQTQLNHVTEYFDGKAGDADFFAAEAHKLIAEFESRRLNEQELLSLYSGRVALSA